AILDLAPSPDGRWLAFTVRDDRGPRRTRLLSLTPGSSREVPMARAYVDLNWTADSRSLMGVLSRDVSPGAAELWRAPIDGTAAERIDLGVHGFASVRLDRSGRRVLVMTPTP